MTTSRGKNDAQVSALVDRHTARHTDGEDADADALFASLEDEDDSAFRAARAQQLSEELKNYKPANGARHVEMNAAVQTLSGDDEVLRFTTENTKVVVHFLHPEFARCSVMDRHLDVIASTHQTYDGDHDGAKFGRVDVKNVGFVVEKLGVRVLPCVIGFKDGVVAGRVVGFEGIVWGGREDRGEVTKALEEKLVEWKMLGKKLVRDAGVIDGHSSESEEETPATRRRGITGQKSRVDHQDDDDDWD